MPFIYTNLSSKRISECLKRVSGDSKNVLNLRATIRQRNILRQQKRQPRWKLGLKVVTFFYKAYGTELNNFAFLFF